MEKSLSLFGVFSKSIGQNLIIGFSVNDNKILNFERVFLFLGERSIKHLSTRQTNV